MSKCEILVNLLQFFMSPRQFKAHLYKNKRLQTQGFSPSLKTIDLISLS